MPPQKNHYSVQRDRITRNEYRKPSVPDKNAEGKESANWWTTSFSIPEGQDLDLHSIPLHRSSGRFAGILASISADETPPNPSARGKQIDETGNHSN